MPNLRFMFLGDIVGQSGCAMVQKWIPKLKEKYKFDGLIVNGENSSNRGKGIGPKLVQFFKDCGVDIITSGNHIFQKKEIFETLNERNDIIRPANYPAQCPGKGFAIFEKNNFSIAVINLQGQIFMHQHLDSPFRTVESILTFLRTKTNIIFVDFHAEATSEKQVMGLFLDGKVSAVLGTHTHVQTADEKIMPGGTAFISDLGFCGAQHSVIGDKYDIILRHFLTQMPAKFEVEIKGPMVLFGAIVDVDTNSGKALKIERVKVVDDEIQEMLKSDKTPSRSP
ncbi:MAG: TIGR00282 family metallophosphoesterase [bacterium]